MFNSFEIAVIVIVVVFTIAMHRVSNIESIVFLSLCISVNQFDSLQFMLPFYLFFLFLTKLNFYMCLLTEADCANKLKDDYCYRIATEDNECVVHPVFMAENCRLQCNLCRTLPSTSTQSSTLTSK